MQRVAMDALSGLGRVFLILGGILIILGLVFLLAPRVPLLGRLPGDIFIRRDGLAIFFPIVTMLLLSIVLSVVLNVILRLFR